MGEGASGLLSVDNKSVVPSLQLNQDSLLLVTQYIKSQLNNSKHNTIQL